MQQVTHSPFLQALGYAIINSLWQFALLWLVYVLVNAVCKLSPHKKYVTGFLLQIVGFTWFVGTLVFYYKQCSFFADDFFLKSNAVAQTFTKFNGATSRDTIFIWLLKAERLLPYLAIAYLSLLLFLGAKWIQAYRFTQLVRTSGLQKIEVSWRLFVKKISLELGIKHEVKIFVSEMVKTPLTIGFFKPLILIPLASINNLSLEQLEAIILHELAHIKRLDYISNLILAFIETTLFFNPFMLLINADLKKERENCCDDWVLQYDYSATTYARALLQIASQQASTPVLALKAAGDKHELLQRVKRMIGKKEKKLFNYRHQLMAQLVITVVLFSFALLTSTGRIKNINATGKAIETAPKPLAAQIDNPLFNPAFFFSESMEVIKVNEKASDSDYNKAIINRQKALVNKTNKVREDKVQNRPSTSVLPEKTKVFLVYLPENDNELGTAFTNPCSEKELELTAENLKKSADIINQRQELFTKQQIIAELEVTLRQLKDVKIQLDLAKVYSSIQRDIKNLEKANRSLALQPDVAELKALTKQIQMQVKELKKVGKINFTSNNISLEYNYNFELPEVILTPDPPEVSHHFSYEYFRKPGVKVIVAPVREKDCKQQKQQIKLAEVPDNDLESPEENMAPSSPVRRPLNPFSVSHNLIIKI